MPKTRSKTASAPSPPSKAARKTRDDHEYVDELTHVSPSVRARDATRCV
jgi:hypothetical protein